MNRAERLLHHPFVKAGSVCAIFVTYYATTRLRSIEQITSSRFLLVSGVVVTGALLTGTWELASGSHWSWIRSFLTTLAVTVFVMWITIMNFGH